MSTIIINKLAMKCWNTDLKTALLWLKELSSYEQEFLSQRLDLIVDLYHAQSKLDSFALSISVKQRKPKFWEIRFSYEDLTEYDSLKRYTWEYGFVVPTMWSKTKRILRGEKRLKYPS